MLDVELFGSGPAGPHIVNVLFHAANTILVFLFLKQISGALWKSALVAALFALHPLHVESVAWISERKDVLSAFFGLLSLWMYALHVEKNRSDKIFTPSSFFWSALLFFSLGLMSKPMLVTLPFVMLLLDFWPLQRLEQPIVLRSFSSTSRLLWEKTPFFFFSAVACAVTLGAQSRSAAVQTLAAFPLNGRVGNTFVACAKYLEKTFWPADLACLYPHPGSWPWVAIIPACFLVAGLCVAAFWFGKKLPFVFVGWFWFLGMLVPVFGLVQVGFQFMADRYTYLPLVGLFLALVWGMGEIIARWRTLALPAYFLGVVVLVACGAQTRNQLYYWQNGETLFRHAIAVTKNNYIAYNDLGYFLSKHGHLQEAIDNFRKALQIKPDYEPTLANLGNALIVCNQYDQAITCYETLLRIDPSDAAAYSNLGYALTAKGRLDEAIGNYQKALQIKPGLVDSLVNLSGALALKGRLEEASSQYRVALLLAPNDPQIHLALGGVLKQQGKLPEAADEFRAALCINPNYQEAKLALQKLEGP